MELFDNEAKNRDYFFDKLKDNEEIAAQGCFIDKEIPIPYKHVYMPVRNTFEIWCSKQDICVYMKLFDKAIDTKNTVLASNEKNILKVDFENNVKNKDIGMPFVIIEAKMPNVNTHELLASSEKIKMIKSIFPYCKSFLMIFGIPKPKIVRLFSGFDDIFILDKLDDKDCNYYIKRIVNETNKAYGYVMTVAKN